ncbi:Rrf2 family transcriptional regulator [Hyphomicrobium sp. ghe19]|uniref:RrF2 family transcriptional regulator n=1 Tax=Hyphomicrobium sp. ghe19 TaxID=2682968 RepID=UPI001366A15C|nr:HTH-type transcriptional repressor NsrR [Hyphomicrobium sp. ghe19]
MRLTALADYSLRVLMYLGTNPDRLATIDEIADAYGISSNHLMKVVHRLGQLGFVETQRGRGGGLRLGKPSGEVTLGEVVRAVEEDFELVECFGAGNTCLISDVCRLKRVLRRALEAYFEVLDDWTLADIVANRKALLGVLGNADQIDRR